MYGFNKSYAYQWLLAYGQILKPTLVVENTKLELLFVEQYPALCYLGLRMNYLFSNGLLANKGIVKV